MTALAVRKKEAASRATAKAIACTALAVKSRGATKQVATEPTALAVASINHQIFIFKFYFGANTIYTRFYHSFRIFCQILEWRTLGELFVTLGIALQGRLLRFYA